MDSTEVRSTPANVTRRARGIVSDIDAARAALIECGVAVSELFHDSGGVFFHDGGKDRVSGPAPARRSYGTCASFSGPDGNGWLFQEVTARLPDWAAWYAEYIVLPA